ncbi:MAG: UxaA family hydrolase [Synergistaceae bacterium]|jgi:hypothetical protein|nr:UxaA family hydrolase [Synergistaceae bacterium]
MKILQFGGAGLNVAVTPDRRGLLLTGLALRAHDPFPVSEMFGAEDVIVERIADRAMYDDFVALGAGSATA